MTLIEIMIALLLMTIVALALMQSAIVVINNNIKNELRDAAVSVAEQRMNELRNDLWTDSDLVATSLVTDPTITRTIRGVSAFPFTPQRAVTDINTNAKQVSLTISWTYRGQQYTHNVSTVLRNE